MVTAPEKINVLVVDDSKVARMLLLHVLEKDPRIRVIGDVHDGHAAIRFVQENRPDVILMDIHMPEMDGFETTRRIMELQPVPIIICTATTDPREVANSFHLLDAGAVACVEKPVAPEHPDFGRLVEDLLTTVKLMSEVKVVRRWGRKGRSTPTPSKELGGDQTAAPRIVGIGASTGGPPVLQTILAALPSDFPLPVLVVQHIAQGFLPGLVEWLKQTTGREILIGTHGTLPLPGHVYIAPDDCHMGVTRTGRITLSRSEPLNGLRPAVDYLFKSLAEAYGAGAVGVLLSGMGKDGAVELKHMKDRGACTIVQDRASSVVHGMPGEAIALNAAGHVLPPEKIACALINLGRQEPPVENVS